MNRSEGALIAWTWKTFIDGNGSDPEILSMLPMTKVSTFGHITKTRLFRYIENFKHQKLKVFR